MAYYDPSILCIYVWKITVEENIGYTEMNKERNFTIHVHDNIRVWPSCQSSSNEKIMYLLITAISENYY